MITNSIANIVVATALINAPIQPMEDLNEVLCMAEAIYFESRGETRIGKTIVGLVIKNRVEDHRYPNTYCEVIKQRWQFSYNNDGQPVVNLPNKRVPDAEALKDSVQLAIDISNGHIADFTNGSLHYFAQDVVLPQWASYGEIELVYGNHTVVNNIRNK